MALWAFSEMSLKLPMKVVWATYGIPWATMIFVRFFFCCSFPGTTLPTGVVVVSAKWGVEEERWIPVFIYASLS